MFMQLKNKFLRSALAAMALALSIPALAYKSPLEVPAMPSRFAATTNLLGVARAGSRLVAVGLHGHIVYSDDEGKSWIQAQVPVSSDLVAVIFTDEKTGWATGHYGVVLHTVDGGKTWQRQLDGDIAADITAHYYAGKTGAEITPDMERVTRQAKALVAEKNSRSLLGIWFENSQVGFVVGTFNRIFRTEDGGKTWTPWMDRTDNPTELHFYSVYTDGKESYLTGEQGRIWRFDKVKNRFSLIQTPYNGTLFGLIVDGDNLLVYGMRGSLLHSGDQGKTWERIDPGTRAGISGGCRLPDGRIVLADQAGGVHLSSDHGKTFAPVKVAKPMSYFGVTPISDNKLVLVGSDGVRVESLQ